MKVAVISDVHGNATALQAVLKDVEARDVEAVWFLGDILGYGPLPVTCINLLDAYNPPVWLMGNHDRAGLLVWETGRENPPELGKLIPTPGDEWRIILWHVEQLKVGLSPERLGQLAAAPTWTEATSGVYAAHGAIRATDPHDARNISSDGNSYVQPGSPALDDTLDALRRLAEEKDASLPWLVVVGHTHRLTLCRAGWERPRRPNWLEGFELAVNAEPVPLDAADGQVTILCPGSAGYPRSRRGDPRAAYAILDLTERLAWFRRVAYNVREAWAAMVQPPRNLGTAVDNWAQAVQADCSAQWADDFDEEQRP